MIWLNSENCVRIVNSNTAYGVFFSLEKGQHGAAVTRPQSLSIPLCHTYSKPSGHEDSPGTMFYIAYLSKNRSFWVFLAIFGVPKMALGVPESKFYDHFSIQIPPLKPPFRHFGNHFGHRKSDFWPFYCFWSFSHKKNSH